MTPEQIMDTIRDLPPQFAFILALITILGTSGFFTGLFAVWKLYAQAAVNRQTARDAKAANESKARLEAQMLEQKSHHEQELARQTARIDALELRRIQAQSEAKQAAAASENMQKLIDALSTGNDRWQKVIDGKSERQLEADKLQHETNKMFIAAVKQQTETVANISEMLEIQSEHLGGFGRVMQHFESKLDSTLQTVEGLAGDNRTDIQTALGNNIKYQNMHDETLRSIMTAVQGLRSDVSSIVSTNEKQKNQTLQSIDAKITVIERNISNLIAPRPEQLPVTLEPDEADDAA